MTQPLNSIASELDPLVEELLARGLHAPPTVTPYERLVLAVEALSLAKTDAVIRRIVSQVARVLTGADGASYVVRDGDRCAYVDEDAIGPLWKGRSFPMDVCVSGWSMRQRAPVVISDINRDPRVPQDAYRATFVKSLVIVPIRTTHPVGAIGVYWADHHEATPEEVRLLQSLADAASVAAQNVRLFENLQRSLDILRQRNREIERFVEMVSHDLRTPSVTIGNYVGLLRARLEVEDATGAKEALTGLETTARHMAALLEDLSLFLRTGEPVTSPTPVSLQSVVNEALALHAEQLGDHRVELRVCEVADSLVADQSRLLAVFQHLIRNAVEHRGAGRPLRLEISASREGDSVHCTVRDNGVGIDPLYLERIFGIFNRVEGRNTGTGVGLSIARRIVEAHGGRMWAESGGAGQGAAFHFTLSAEPS